MSCPPRVRSTNVIEPEIRPVLRPAANNAPMANANTLKPTSKPSKKPDKLPQKSEPKDKKGLSTPPVSQKSGAAALLQHQEMVMGPKLARSASCSSDASSSDSSQSRTSSRMDTGRRTSVMVRKKKCSMKADRPDSTEADTVEKVGDDGGLVESLDAVEVKKRCSWVTPNTDLNYAAFHDEEWGFPVHDDRRLFELLCLSGALAELTWPAILTKRHIFREVFLDFDPVSVSKLNEKKVTAPGSPAISLLSEPKLRAIIENARQMCQVIEEFGSFDKYIWNFVNHNPLVSHFKYSRQVPAKTSKAEFISKELIKRGFRSVSPTVVYSFMQVAGLTNDHLVSCFRFHECITFAEAREKDDRNAEDGKKTSETSGLILPRAKGESSSPLE
ncbi:uncharacterized protein LOC115752754 [Rhodamnia argentea]|uniref:Uncharacterized protein LOC115752754 n=1 Tax=Rhodamnia argentea TaxID=178133 RepID=A0A8B8QIE7_9MYRT|nr:uncharacterized protein LOC115752754 [Rhodamnia argentea]XP_048130930.1 uncharacterized protein LOC115752754 [Rhodamnia argentea]